MTSVNRFDRLVLNGTVDVRESFDGNMGGLTMSAANAPRYLPGFGSFGSETTDHPKDRGFTDAGSLPISYTLAVVTRMKQLAI
ncbi:hypothetical protein NLM31_07420 [Bradyrhizobium sp. CCGUVB4N]|uniref:hypothetical protein n=1 Tax=Bradyrhizobium sp. CCGUVB4N TaxID=2949631 RepID=UPI0020B27420|nr:hypothetical protein [Bradyrhizobium sp. CCGUVB4N]MCP3380229.1 hypothetical protein [Bradyrhizobium sp. CCGUVB4N]